MPARGQPRRGKTRTDPATENRQRGLASVAQQPLFAPLAGWGRFGLERTLAGFASGRVLDYAGPLHLWFLEYLILFYGLAVIAVRLLGIIGLALAGGILLLWVAWRFWRDLSRDLAR